MHSIKYKHCLAQQDSKTLAVTVSKEGCHPASFGYAHKLSGKELRTVVNRYLCLLGGNGNG